VSSVERCLRRVLCFAVFLVPASHLPAQVTATAPPLSVDLENYNNRWDAFGGFSYTKFQTTIGHALKGNLYGFKVQGTAWFNPIIGLSLATNNYSGSVGLPPNAFNIPSADVSEHMLMLGPEIRFYRRQKWTVDAHLLLGGTYGIFDNSFHNTGVTPNYFSLYNNQLAFAMALGGTFDRNLKPNWSVRIITDYQPTRYGLAFQNEFSGSVGVVYKLGALPK
jgi:hypothetical protein